MTSFPEQVAVFQRSSEEYSIFDTGGSSQRRNWVVGRLLGKRSFFSLSDLRVVAEEIGLEVVPQSDGTTFHLKRNGD